MGYDNPSFESEDPAAEGYATFWTQSYNSTAEEAAEYDDGTTIPPGQHTPVENFEGDWDSNEDFLFEYADPADPLELEAAEYDTIEEERFIWVPLISDWGDVSSDASAYDGNIVLESDSETFAVDDGDFLRLTNEIGGPVDSDPVESGYAYEIAETTGPCGFLIAGEQFRITTHVGTWVITVDNTDVDVIHVAQKIRDQTGNEVFSFYSGVPIKIYVQTLATQPKGTAAFFRLEEITSGVLAKCGWSPSQINVNHYGSGNVALDTVATAEEILAILQGTSAFGPLGIGFTETPGDGVMIHTNPEGTLRVDSGGALGAAMGFVLDTTFGPVAESTEDYEDHEEGWLPDGFLASWDDVTDDVASYDTTPQAFEDFEEEWRSNEDYVVDWDDVTDDIASYDTGVGGADEEFEDFEEVHEVFAFSVVVATDDISEVGHGLTDDQIVVLTNVGGELPGGLHPNYTYYVTGAVANFFGVAATLGGSKVDILDTGIGTHYCTPDRSVFWTTVMVTL